MVRVSYFMRGTICGTGNIYESRDWSGETIYGSHTWSGGLIVGGQSVE